jgi:hypothetical protein
MCPACHHVVPLVDGEHGQSHCGNSNCKASVQKCTNYEEHKVCNRLVLVEDSIGQRYCDYCALTEVIPDLSVAGNLEKWRKLEAAKQRVLFMLDRISMPFRGTAHADDPQLAFRFEADTVEPVLTGHNNGCITINIREADSVERERSRVEFHEPQRTLVGHFRHELGHFFWDRLIRANREGDFRSVFGDERNPDYSTALQRYYQNGPPANWQENFISAYAAMHPWEDFAETFSAYLVMISIVDTARHFDATHSEIRNFDSIVENYGQIGLIANEFNREMGLLDLVPHVFVPPVIEKLRFIHELRGEAQTAQPDQSAAVTC